MAFFQKKHAIYYVQKRKLAVYINENFCNAECTQKLDKEFLTIYMKDILRATPQFQKSLVEGFIINISTGLLVLS